MRIRQLGCIAALAALALSTAAAAGGCQLAHLGDLPVDMQGPRPLVWAKINGVKARFMLDTGAYYSMISHDTATQYQLRLGSTGAGFSLRGAGGKELAQVTSVKSFEFLGVPVPNLQFLVIDRSFDSNSAGLLGQNVLRFSDVEYDLANGILRFFKPVNCGHEALAYWAVSTPYSSVDLQAMDIVESQLRATAMVNGHRITIMFDTGSSRSLLSLDAAARAGISPNSPGVTFLGLMGGTTNKLWSAPVDTFQLGGEKVQHAHLVIADLDPAHQTGEVGVQMPDMLLGDDFFLSHRIYVAYSQRKLYFTYNWPPLQLESPTGSLRRREAAGNPGCRPGRNPDDRRTTRIGRSHRRGRI